MSTSTPVRLTLREPAANTGLHIATVQRRIHRGELPAVSIGNRHLVAAVDLDAAILPMLVPVVSKQVTTTSLDALEAAAIRVAAAAPPLSAQQRARITSLLGGG